MNMYPAFFIILLIFILTWGWVHIRTIVNHEDTGGVFFSAQWLHFFWINMPRVVLPAHITVLFRKTCVQFSVMAVITYTVINNTLDFPFSGANEMTQWVKYLLPKYEDLNLDWTHQWRSQKRWHISVTSVLVWETGRSRGSLASHFKRNVSFRYSVI